MKSVFKKLAAGAVIATASMAASALTLSFDDLPVPPGGLSIFGTDISATYQGFDFSSATGTPGTVFYVAEQTPSFPASSGTQNITGFSGAPPGFIDGFVISSPTLFRFDSAFFSGFGDIFIELITENNTSIPIGLFDSTFNPANATVALGVGGGSATFTNSVYNGLLLKEIVIWAQSDAFSVDDIVVTPIPEPSTYALMALGLAGIGFVARRRRMGERV